MEKGTIKIDGISTQQDVDKILNALHDVWGVRKAVVNMNRNEAEVSFDEKAASFQDFEQAIIDTGYRVGKE